MKFPQTRLGFLGGFLYNMKVKDSLAVEEVLSKTTEKFLVHLLHLIDTHPQQKCLKFHLPSFQEEINECM